MRPSEVGSEMGLFQSATGYEATQVDERMTQPADAVPGQLLQIVPFKDNEGITGGARLLRDIHNVTWGGVRDRTNVSDHHAFELWFNEGSVSFYLHAGSESAAEKYITRIENSYSNSDVARITDGIGFPAIDAGDYVVGCEIGLEKHQFYPIRHFRAEGFEHDPYSGIISEMLSIDDTRVVVQVTMRPEPSAWAANDGGGFLRRGVSVDDVAEGLKEGGVTGFIHPRTRDPSKKDREAAKIIEQQRGKYAYSVNLRVLAISPDPAEAEARCEGVAGMFERYYNSKTEQGFEASPVAPARVREVVADCHQRTWRDNETILTIDELAGATHIPNTDIEVPNIGWKNTQRGARVSPEAVHDK
jgi:hypothetical protein